MVPPHVLPPVLLDVVLPPPVPVPVVAAPPVPLVVVVPAPPPEDDEAEVPVVPCMSVELQAKPLSAAMEERIRVQEISRRMVGAS
jgi:hypothetical protein